MPENEKVLSNFIDEKEENQESLFFIPDNPISGEFTDEPIPGTLCMKDSFGQYVKISDLINQKTNLEKSGFPDSTILNTSRGFAASRYVQKTTLRFTSIHNYEKNPYLSNDTIDMSTENGRKFEVQSFDEEIRVEFSILDNEMGILWVIDHPNQEKLEEYRSTLQQLGQKAQLPRNFYELDLVLAFFEETGEWDRGIILEMSENDATVLFTDFGNVADSIPHEFLKLG